MGPIEVLGASGNVVRTVNLPRERKGKHVFYWDGRDDSGSRVGSGSYRVKITAADFGYATWTQISTDTTRDLQFEYPRSVAVNHNIDPLTREATPYYNPGQIAVDAVGNVYTAYHYTERMRIFSPPDGPNSSATAKPLFAFSQTGTGGPKVATISDQGGCPGQDAVFTAVATETTGTVTYQWQKNGVNVGTNSPTLTLSGITASDDGSGIQVLVCDINGVAVSNVAILVVGMSVTVPPQNTPLLCAGSNAEFSVQLRGAAGTPIYQWKKKVGADTVDVGTDSPTLSLPVTAADDGGLVSVVVSDACSTATSSTAILNVEGSPTLGVSGGKTLVPAARSGCSHCR